MKLAQRVTTGQCVGPAYFPREPQPGCIGICIGSVGILKAIQPILRSRQQRNRARHVPGEADVGTAA